MHTPPIQKNISLAPYTAFQVGGKAEYFIEVHSTTQLESVLSECSYDQLWLLGFGSNTLISDEGLPGLTLCIRGGDLHLDDSIIIADSGVWWDDIVQLAIKHNLWGIELLGEIPGSIGAALYINITAYGQSIGNSVLWIDVWNPKTKKIERLKREELEWSYKQSIFQQPEYADYIILRAAIKLSEQLTDELSYQKAVDVATELQLDHRVLSDRRKIIHEARSRAGSLWTPDTKNTHRTAGSFFRNPVVPARVAEAIMSFDESGKTIAEVKLMNKVHGGDSLRVSAAHVMLAAGFRRGQSWGPVKLNDQNLLKIEALEGATAQDIYTVMHTIQQTCLEKLGITLEEEARILGTFKPTKYTDPTP